MASNPERLKQLQVAGAFCVFDKKLRSSGTSSIVWGAINLLIGVLAISENTAWGSVSLTLGLGLVIAGIYERTVRDPKVILISAGTLAALALWNLTLIGLAAMGKVGLALGGRTLFWAIAQAAGAFATWKTFSTYKTLRDESDVLTVEQVRGYLGELKKVKPSESVHVIEFDVNAGFLQATKRYRLLPVEDQFLVASYKVELGSMKLEDVNFVPREAVTLSVESGKWMSKKVKATIQLGPITLQKVTIAPEMALRINPAAQTVPA